MSKAGSLGLTGPLEMLIGRSLDSDTLKRRGLLGRGRVRDIGDKFIGKATNIPLDLRQLVTPSGIERRKSGIGGKSSMGWAGGGASAAPCGAGKADGKT